MIVNFLITLADETFIFMMDDGNSTRVCVVTLSGILASVTKNKQTCPMHST